MHGDDDCDEILRMSAELRGKSFLARAKSARIIAESKDLIIESAWMRVAVDDLRQERSCP